MNKIELSHLDVSVFHEQLENGLNVYVVPKCDVNNIYATFSTNYGSMQSEFVPLGEKKMKKVPLGVAHFLEHKMFEQKDGKDPFKFFGERGCDANANTSNYKTTYLFSGTDFFEENINFLLDYVQSPYFTDKNVDKERGIIEQEIKMYQDDVYSRLYETVLYNCFKNNPIKYPVIGDIKSIKAITKEDLYTCYNTFYHPSNMFVVVSGNVEPKEVIEIIKNNQDNKEFDKFKKIEIKKYTEPDEVEKKKQVIKMNVTVPKVAVNYKVNISNIKGMHRRMVMDYFNIFFCIKFGESSLFNENLREEKIITDSLDVSVTDAKTHLLCTIVGETKQKELLIEKIREEMKDLSIEASDFERKQKSFISSLIYTSDNVFRLNHKVMNDVNRWGFVIDNDFEEIKALNIEAMRKCINQMSFENYNIVIIESE